MSIAISHRMSIFVCTGLAVVALKASIFSSCLQTLGSLRGGAPLPGCKQPCTLELLEIYECAHISMDPTTMCGENNACSTTYIYYSKCEEGYPQNSEDKCKTHTDLQMIRRWQELRTMPTLACQSPQVSELPGYDGPCFFFFAFPITVRCLATNPCAGSLVPGFPVSHTFFWGVEDCGDPPAQE